MICLDTNVIIDLLGFERPQVRRRLGEAQAAGETLCLSSIALFELRYGVALSARQVKNERVLAAALEGGIEVIPFDAGDAQDAGDLRATLRKMGGQIGGYDLLIAAQARRRNAPLVTHNVSEFERVPGLIVIDWAA